MTTPPRASACVIFSESVFPSSKVIRIRFSAGLAKRMIPSMFLRIELILAKGPQAVQPGIFNSNVCSAAASGQVNAKTSTSPARRLKKYFPFMIVALAIRPKYRPHLSTHCYAMQGKSPAENSFLPESLSACRLLSRPRVKPFTSATK